MVEKHHVQPRCLCGQITWYVESPGTKLGVSQATSVSNGRNSSPNAAV